MKEHNLNKYDPSEFEENLYKEWNERGYFTPVVDKSKTPYTIVIPPPNGTCFSYDSSRYINKI